MKTPRGETVKPGSSRATLAAKKAVLKANVDLTAKGKPRRLPIVDLASAVGVVLAEHGPFVDGQGHLVVQAYRDAEHVHFIAKTPWGFRLHKMPLALFDKYYRPLLDDPEACARFLRPIKEIGAPPDVVKHAAKFIHITPEELDMAEKKQTKKVTEFKERVQAAKDLKRGATPTASKVKQGPKPKAEKKPKASSMFKELILAGKLSDEDIFKAVKKEFGLDDKKRSYVAWYRNDLKKNGQNPPAAK